MTKGWLLKTLFAFFGLRPNISEVQGIDLQIKGRKRIVITANALKHNHSKQESIFTVL